MKSQHEPALTPSRSWADAPVASHLFGFMHDHENAAFNFSVPHDDCATNSAERQGGAKKVKTIRFKWKLSSDIAEAIDKVRNLGCGQLTCS